MVVEDIVVVLLDAVPQEVVHVEVLVGEDLLEEEVLEGFKQIKTIEFIDCFLFLFCNTINSIF